MRFLVTILDTKMMRSFLTGCFVLLISVAAAQSKKDAALAKGKEAIRLEEEEGKFDEAIKLLQECSRLDPGNINYPYEMAYAYSAKKTYQQSIDILQRLILRKDAHARIYQALGNAYDLRGQHEKANDIYQKGLERFPNAGELYLESGNMRLLKKDYDTALRYYEKGIEKDPGYASNYYWACRLFFGTEEKAWAMIYGELFMLLETNTKRTKEISGLLYKGYQHGIRFTSDSSFVLAFGRNALSDTIGKTNSIDKTAHSNFISDAYETTLMRSMQNEHAISLETLDSTRSRFPVNYFQANLQENFPNILFDYQLKVKQAGHMDAYNYWVLSQGDQKSFTIWTSTHDQQWKKFLNWFTDNPLKPDEHYKFYRAQYLR